MKVICRMVVPLLAAVLTGSGSYAESQPVERKGISFSLPFSCGGEPGDKRKDNEVVCLAGSFEAGLKVVLVCTKASCTGKTAGTFLSEHVGHEFDATHLTGTAECSTEVDDTWYKIAVVGIAPSAVNVLEPQNDKSSLSQDMEAKARKIAGSGYRDLSAPGQPVRDVADSAPDVFRAGNAAFVLFKCTDEFLNQDGLPVVVLNNNAFLLDGSCALRSPFFFTVNNRLHVLYWATVSCCGCGDSNLFVYDLSGESPELVYQNTDFSD
ncbi:MAG: hypothetical protein V1792_16235 [Pseudomonadota bacterium]